MALFVDTFDKWVLNTESLPQQSPLNWCPYNQQYRENVVYGRLNQVTSLLSSVAFVQEAEKFNGVGSYAFYYNRKNIFFLFRYFDAFPGRVAVECFELFELNYPNVETNVGPTAPNPMSYNVTRDVNSLFQTFGSTSITTATTTTTPVPPQIAPTFPALFAPFPGVYYSTAILKHSVKRENINFQQFYSGTIDIISKGRWKMHSDGVLCLGHLFLADRFKFPLSEMYKSQNPSVVQNFISTKETVHVTLENQTRHEAILYFNLTSNPTLYLSQEFLLRMHRRFGGITNLANYRLFPFSNSFPCIAPQTSYRTNVHLQAVPYPEEIEREKREKQLRIRGAITATGQQPLATFNLNALDTFNVFRIGGFLGANQQLDSLIQNSTTIPQFAQTWTLNKPATNISSSSVEFPFIGETNKL